MRKTTITLKQGGIIAYPTEAVYGLGCDPWNQAAVLKILALKQRNTAKGLILLAAQWEHIEHLLKPIPKTNLKKVLATWPGPITWVFPANKSVPPWITGNHNTIAIRITNHPVAKSICQDFGKPIVSTSANLTATPPLLSYQDVKNYFPNGIDLIVRGKVGSLQHPTPIYDARSGKILRK
jgi:L-threonylcarbamoyladenylate synthase